MLPVKPMNIQDYFAPADGSSKIASYFELEAALKAQASATPTQTIQQTSNPVEVKSTPKTNFPLNPDHLILVFWYSASKGNPCHGS
jgi:hypothetical protein